MSEHITHVAVYEDVARIVLESGGFPEAFTESLRTQWDAGFLASASRGNHLFAIPFLEKYRDRWSSRPADGSVETRIAAALGWLTHRAADLQMKPLGWEMEARSQVNPRPLGDTEVSETEHEIYQDAVAFREVYGGGRVQPQTPHSPLSSATFADDMNDHPAAAGVDVDQVEPLVAAAIQQDLLGLQSFTTSAGDAASWADAFTERLNGFTEDLQVYVDAYQRPDSVKMLYYIDRVHWYDAGDEVIRWARALQRGLPAPDIPLEEAVEMGRTQSQYAQAIHKGFHFLSSAAKFFERRITKDEAYDAVEIFHEPHRI